MYFRKIIYCSAIFLLALQGCSTGRKALFTDDISMDRNNIKDIAAGCAERNISDKDLIISRARIQYKSDEINRTVSGFIKYSKKGELLLSLRSVAGIEVARVFINSDSIKVHDKINNLLYIQSLIYLKDKYGIGHDDIVLLWGDLPSPLISLPSTEDKAGDLNYSLRRGETSYSLEFDNEYLKLKKTELSHINGNNTRFKFEDYNNEHGLVYPRNVELIINNGEIEINIKYSGAKSEKIKSMKFTTETDIRTLILK